MPQGDSFFKYHLFASPTYDPPDPTPNLTHLGGHPATIVFPVATNKIFPVLSANMAYNRPYNPDELPR
jgi:hypothetical protein